MEYKELQEKYGRIASHLDEKSRRLWCANEALAIGRGGYYGCVRSNRSFPDNNN